MIGTIEALQDLKIPALKKRYRELFGEESKSSNKQFLFRRIAYRLQANAEGDLNERARRRAADIADDRDLRVRAPKGIRGSTRFRFRKYRSHTTVEGSQVTGTRHTADPPGW